jgi:hypothetical protein
MLKWILERKSLRTGAASGAVAGDAVHPERADGLRIPLAIKIFDQFSDYRLLN